MKDSDKDSILTDIDSAIESSGEPEEVRSSGVKFKPHKKSEDVFGDEWIPITLKKAMASVLGHKDGDEMSAEKRDRNPKALEADQKKVMLMDALIDLAREMAKKKTKERAMAKMASKELENAKNESKEMELDLLATFTPPPPSKHSDMKEAKQDQLYPEEDRKSNSSDYDDTVWHVNPFRSEQDPVTRRTLPETTTTAKPTPTTIRFPLEEFLEDTVSNPLIDNGLFEDTNDDTNNDTDTETSTSDEEYTERAIRFPTTDPISEETEVPTSLIPKQLPRQPKELNINDESFDRGRITLATLATLTDAELNEEFNLIGHEGVSTQKPIEQSKELRTIIVRRDKDGNIQFDRQDLFNLRSKSPLITPLPDIFRQQGGGKPESDIVQSSSPSPISILGGQNFQSFTVQPTQSTLRTIKFTPTTAAAPIADKSVLNKSDFIRKAKTIESTDPPNTATTWVWQTKEMDEHGNEVITNTEKLAHNHVLQKLQKSLDENTEKDMEPTQKLTEEDFVLLGDSWFNDKSKSLNRLKMPDVLTLPSEPKPTASNLDVEEDALSSPTPDQATNRLDLDANAQPLELINPFMIASPSLTPQSLSSIDTQNKPYSLEENHRTGSKNWVLLSSTHNGNYEYDFDSIDAIETYDDYYNNDYDDDNEFFDKNRKFESTEFEKAFKKGDDKQKLNKKPVSFGRPKDSFRPSIKLSSVLPSSNSFLPSRSNGASFREFVGRQDRNGRNDRNGDFGRKSKEVSSKTSWPAINSNVRTSVDGDYRETSFTSFPFRTNAKTLQQLISEAPLSSKNSQINPALGLIPGRVFEQNEIHSSNNHSQKSLTKDSNTAKRLGSTGRKLNDQLLLKESRSSEDISSRRASKNDSDQLMVFYPLHGKPFLSFPPSKSFSTIAKRQIL